MTDTPLPPGTEFQVIRAEELHQDDVVVFKLPDANIPPERAQALDQWLRLCFPRNKVIILLRNQKLKIISPQIGLIPRKVVDVDR